MITEKNTRENILKNYAKQQSLKCCKNTAVSEDAQLTIVIPAYNEELRIRDCLQSIIRTKRKIEIIVVDNASTDKTKAVTETIAKNSRHPIRLLFETKRGPVHARKRGLDEVVIQYLSKEKYDQKKFIALIDADTYAEKNWVESICNVVDSNSNISALGGVHGIYPWVDVMIEKKIGLRSYFNSLALLAYKLTQNGCALVHTDGANFAIEVAAYASVGGSVQPVNRESRKIKGSDRRFGIELRRLNKTIGFIPTMTYTSPRSLLMPILRQKNPEHFRTFKTWADVREDDIQLLNNALKLPLRMWKENDQLRKRLYIKNAVILPLLQKQLDATKELSAILGKNHKLFQDLKKFNRRDELTDRHTSEYYANLFTQQHYSDFVDAIL